MTCEPARRSKYRHGRLGAASFIYGSAAICALWIVPLMPTNAGAQDKPAQGEGGCLTEEAKERIAVLTKKRDSTYRSLNEAIRLFTRDEDRLGRSEEHVRVDEIHLKEATTKAERERWEREVSADKGVSTRIREDLNRWQTAFIDP